MPPTSCDLAVVGAGAAGLAAARTAQARGLRVVVLEAKDRIGGRAYTESASLGVPFDHGCHWLHSASRNPFVPIARQLGFSVASEDNPRRIFLGDRWATADELASWQDFSARSFAAMEAAAASGRDVAAAAVFDRSDRWAALFDAWLAMVSGVNAADTSSLDHANYVDTRENWPVREGYGALVARYGADLPVVLTARVRRIGWGGRTLWLETARGRLSAKAAILTVPTAVLAGGSLRFDPPLPDWKRSAIEALPMGAANKIALRFSRDVFGTPAGRYAVYSTNTAEAISFQVRPFGWPIAIGYVGGKFCQEMERAGPAASIALASEQLGAIFGSSVARHLQATVCTAWQGDRDIGGGYSAARPGSAHRRLDLARPIDDRLFFAGEAASVAFYSTAHGAYLTGVAAADAAADALAGQIGGAAGKRGARPH